MQNAQHEKHGRTIWRFYQGLRIATLDFLSQSDLSWLELDLGLLVFLRGNWLIIHSFVWVALLSHCGPPCLSSARAVFRGSRSGFPSRNWVLPPPIHRAAQLIGCCRQSQPTLCVHASASQLGGAGADLQIFGSTSQALAERGGQTTWDMDLGLGPKDSDWVWRLANIPGF